MELLMWSADYRSIAQQYKKQDNLILETLSSSDNEQNLLIKTLTNAATKVTNVSQSPANSWY